jgi:hypothetical protein
LDIPSPVLFSFVYYIRMFFLGWLSCSLIAASLSEMKVLWTCWLQYKEYSRLLVLDGSTAAAASAKAAMKFGFEMAPTAVKACVGLLCTGIWVIDPVAEIFGCKKPTYTLLGRLTPFVQKHSPEWMKDPANPNYMPKYKRN